MPTISLNSVTRVYRGAANRCCCGCSGVFSENTPKNHRKVLYVLNKLNKSDNTVFEGSHAYVDIGDRTYIAFFN